jgi:hypothetical protein
VNLFFAPYLEGSATARSSSWPRCSSSNSASRPWPAAARPSSPTSTCIGKCPSTSRTCPPSGPTANTPARPTEYEKEAQRFVWKLFEVYKEGDGAGRPFFFPKPLVHITEKFFQTEGHMDFLHHICDVAAEMGNTYFRVRPGRDRQDQRVLPALLQAGAKRPGRRQDPLEDALQRPAERDHQPAPHRL